ncbi:MAG: transporter substrate-binding domain-containing protein [Alteromonadaceae bacterium]|nr:transporter substrate-binding domain-containing protein [Alteromonadaceae bacterium]
MKLIILLVSMSIVSSFVSGQTSEKTLTLAFSKDWKPYIYADKQGKAAGIDLILLKQVLQPLGYTLRNESLPEQRMAIRLEEGKVGVVLGAALTTERLSHNYFSIPYRKETIVLGYKKSRHDAFCSATITEVLQDGKLVALNKSGWFGERLSDQLLTQYADNIVHAEGTQRRMQLLLLDRVDVVVGDINVLTAAAKDLGIDDFAVSAIPVHQTNVHFMFGREHVNAAFVEQFNQVLATLITSGN